MKRGVLDEPRPTAMNMPIPSASACSGPRMSTWRPCWRARSDASSARTSGLTSFADRCDSRRARLPPSPMIRPRSAAALRAAAIALLDARWSARRARVARRTRHGRWHRARRSPPPRRASPAPRPTRASSAPSSAWGSSTASRVTTRSVRRRSMAPPSRIAVRRSNAAASPTPMARIQGEAVSRPWSIADDHGLPRSSPTVRYADRAPPSRRSISATGRGESWITRDGQREHVRLHVPGLADDDTGLHAG